MDVIVEKNVDRESRPDDRDPIDHGKERRLGQNDGGKTMRGKTMRANRCGQIDGGKIMRGKIMRRK